MTIKHSPFTLAALALAAAALSGQAAAVTSASTLCTTMSNNGVSVAECSTGPNSGIYSVTNNSDQAIDWFIVSTDATGSPSAAATRNGWSGFYVTEGQYNSIYQDLFGKSFDQAFGTHDTGAFAYFSQLNAIAVGETTGGEFSFGAAPSSNMIAGNGITILAQSFGATAAVPEPGTYALMGLGLLGLGAAVCRQRQAA